MIEHLCAIVGLGWTANLILGIPYYLFVLRPVAREDGPQAEVEELLGNLVLSLLPWLQAARVLLVVSIWLGWAALWYAAPFLPGVHREGEDDE